MRAFANIFAEIDRPKECAIETKSLQNRFAGEAERSGVARALFAFENNFVLAIAIEIANRRIVGIVTGSKFERDGQILICENQSLERFVPLPTNDRTNCVTCGARIGVIETGDVCERRGV